MESENKIKSTVHDLDSIVITTNNIASLLDLQAIEQYVKSTACVKSEHV